MKLPISWLHDWIEASATPEQVADALTRRGFYVEGIETHGHAYPGVVVARVLEVERHPKADRLSLCRVDAGAEPLQVVCGAPNVRPGMIAPFATVGATLPGGTTIQKAKIRGIESEGMLCSPSELELSDDHDGILDLARHLGGEDGLVPGKALADVLGPPEQILEVEVPFNRPDGLGIVGLAREVKSALGGRWTDPASARLANRWQGRADFPLEIEDPEGCPRYIAQVVDGIAIGPSAPAIRRRLESMGQRPINNIVDLTNFVLFEYGQPLHAFDLAKLKAEWLHAYHQKHPRPLGHWLLGNVHRLFPLGARLAGVANAVARRPGVRWLMEKLAGIDRRRSLPPLHADHFRTWFGRHVADDNAGRLGRVRAADVADGSTAPAIGAALHPGNDGTITCGSSWQQVESPEPEDPAVPSRICEMVTRVVPALADAEFLGSWWGLRPVTPDDRPIVDRVREGLVVATGHGALGVILGAGTAELVAAQVLGSPAPFDPGPFRADRFSASGPL